MANNVDKAMPSQRKERDSFLDNLKRFHNSRGTPFQRFPFLGGQEVDLYLLYNRVTALGGWEKVNENQRWEEIQCDFHIPKACTNGGQALRDIYIRYLDIYEKIHHFGEDPDRKIPESEEQGLPGQRKKVNYTNIVPMSYNHNQHRVASNIRENANLAKLLEPAMASKLEKSLMSGLPNEVDFAVNVCTLLSSEGKHTLQLEKCPRLLTILLGHIGIFEPGISSLKTLHLDGWKTIQRRNYLRFWWESIEDDEVKKLICPDVQMAETEHTDDDHCPPLQDVLCLGRGLGLSDKEGQRVLQVGMIVRNLSFEGENMKVLSSDSLVLRFLMLCVKCKYHSIRQMGLDTLGNIAVYVNLRPRDSHITPFFFSTLSSCIQSADKFEVVTGLDMLARLCQQESNEDVICDRLSTDVYQAIVSYLTVHDIQLIVYTLECLYQLSELGEVTTSQIAQVTRAVASLVALVTIEAQSYGPESIKGIKVVEHIPAGMHGITSQPPAEAQTPVQAAKSGPQKMARPHAAQTTPIRPPVIATPPPSRATPPPASEMDSVLLSWLQCHYESAALNSTVSQMELYSGYLRACTGIKKVPDTRMMTVAVRVSFPRIEVKKVQSAGKTDTIISGIKKRENPMPFSFERTSNATPPPARFPGNVHTPCATPSPPSTPHPPKSKGQQPQKLTFHHYRPSSTPPPPQQFKQGAQFPMPSPRQATPQNPSMLHQALINKQGTSTPIPSPAQPPPQQMHQQPPNLIKSLLVNKAQQSLQNVPQSNSQSLQQQVYVSQPPVNQNTQHDVGNQGQMIYSNPNIPQGVTLSSQHSVQVANNQPLVAQQVNAPQNVQSQNQIQFINNHQPPQMQLTSQTPVSSFQQQIPNVAAANQHSQVTSLPVAQNKIVTPQLVQKSQSVVIQGQANQTLVQNNQGTSQQQLQVANNFNQQGQMVESQIQSNINPAYNAQFPNQNSAVQNPPQFVPNSQSQVIQTPPQFQSTNQGQSQPQLQNQMMQYQFQGPMAIQQSASQNQGQIIQVQQNMNQNQHGVQAMSQNQQGPMLQQPISQDIQGHVFQTQQGQVHMQQTQMQMQPSSQGTPWNNNTQLISQSQIPLQQGEISVQQSMGQSHSQNSGQLQGQIAPGVQNVHTSHVPVQNQWQTNQQCNQQLSNQAIQQQNNWQNQFQQFTQQQQQQHPQFLTTSQTETGKKSRKKSPRTKSPKPKVRKSKSKSIDSVEFTQTTSNSVENDVAEDDGYVCSAVADVVAEIHREKCEAAELLKENQPPEESSKIAVVVEQIKDNYDGAEEVAIEKVENKLNNTTETSIKTNESAAETVISEAASSTEQGLSVGSNTHNNRANGDLIATQAICDDRTVVSENSTVNGINPEESQNSDSTDLCSTNEISSLNSSVEEKKAKIAQLMKETKFIKEQMYGMNGVSNHHQESECSSHSVTQELDTESQVVHNTAISKTNLDMINNQPVLNGFPELPVNGDHTQSFCKDDCTTKDSSSNLSKCTVSSGESPMDTGVPKTDSVNVSFSEDLNRNNNCNDGGDDSGNDSFSLPPSPSGSNINFQVPPVSVPSDGIPSNALVQEESPLPSNADILAAAFSTVNSDRSEEVSEMDTSEVTSHPVIPTATLQTPYNPVVPSSNTTLPISLSQPPQDSSSYVTASNVTNVSQQSPMAIAPIKVTVPTPAQQYPVSQPSQPSPSLKPVSIQPRPVDTAIMSSNTQGAGQVQFVISNQGQQQLLSPQQQSATMGNQPTVVIAQGQQPVNTAPQQQGTMQLALSQPLQPGQQVMVSRMVQGQLQPIMQGQVKQSQQIQGQVMAQQQIVHQTGTNMTQQQIVSGQNMVPQSFVHSQSLGQTQNIQNQVTVQNQQGVQPMAHPSHVIQSHSQSQSNVQGHMPSQTTQIDQNLGQGQTIIQNSLPVQGQAIVHNQPIVQNIVQGTVVNQQGQTIVVNQQVNHGQSNVQTQMFNQGQTVVQNQPFSQGQIMIQSANQGQNIVPSQSTVQTQPLVIQNQSISQGPKIPPVPALQQSGQAVLQTGPQPHVLQQGQAIVQNQVQQFVHAAPAGGQVQQILPGKQQQTVPQQNVSQYIVHSNSVQQQPSEVAVSVQGQPSTVVQSYQTPLQLPSPVPTPPPASPQGSVCSSMSSPAPPTGSKKKRPSSRQSNKSDGDKPDKPKKKRKSRSKSNDSSKSQMSPVASVPLQHQAGFTLVQSPQPQQPLMYMCEWSRCNSLFEVFKNLQTHVQKTHYDFKSPSGLCHWQGCDKMIRQKWSLITHIQEKHLNEASVRAAAVQRQQRVTSPNSTTPSVNPQPLGPPPVYPMDAAIQAIKRFCPKPPYPEFTELKEGPVTKHIRLTSALILRNMARYSAKGRSEIKKHENHLAYVALSPVESSAAISNCLYELHKH